MPELLLMEIEKEDVLVSNRRVLITGATGLLGRAVYKEFKDNNWHVVGCGYTRARPRFEHLNLLDVAAVKTLVQDFKPHVIVHCAAERRPDIVESQPESASMLNVVASGNLAKEAAGVGAFLLYISSDYVFDGTNPPYLEDSVPNPLNFYGKTKLEGERTVFQNNEAFPSSHLRAITDEPVGGTTRPWNPQLDCSKLEKLGIGQRTPFRVGIRESLWPFLVDKRWRQTVFH
ncbi:hypothetical protein FKM82_012011 [Ascaphus truei]